MRDSAYSHLNGMHIMKMPLKDFMIQYADKTKENIGVSNYFNGGFFANFSENGQDFTLPVGNIACDICEKNIAPVAVKYLKERGTITNGKLRINAKSNGTQFKGKVSTLFVYDKGVAQIEATDFVPNDACYAVSGAPVMLKGQDISWSNVVVREGWDESIARPTWHGFLGLKSDGYIYYIGMYTCSLNLFTSSEAYKKLKQLDFVDVIKIDGGSSYIFNLDGSIKAEVEGNRRINNIGRCL